MNRRWTMPIAALATLVPVLLVGSPAPVGATCGVEVTTPMIDAADAAGVGTVLGNNDGLWVIDITADAKGNLPDQVAVDVVDDGDNEWLAGRDVAVLFQLDGDRLIAEACVEPTAEQLAGWTPPTSRPGEVSHLLGGAWGTYRTIGLDASGAPVAYGRGPGQVRALALCDDGSSMAELVTHDSGSAEIAVRSLNDFEVIDSIDTAQADGSMALTCTGSSADQVEITPSADDSFRGPGVAPAWEATATAGLSLAAPFATRPDTTVPAPAELALADPPSVGGWSPWLLVLGVAGGVAYLLKKAQDPEWRSSWNKPDNARNASGGRRREDATGQGYFN